MNCTRLLHISLPESSTPSHTCLIPIYHPCFILASPPPGRLPLHSGHMLDFEVLALCFQSFLTFSLHALTTLDCNFLFTGQSPPPGLRILPSCSLLNYQPLGTTTAQSRHKGNTYCGHLIVNSFSLSFPFNCKLPEDGVQIFSIFGYSELGSESDIE